MHNTTSSAISSTEYAGLPTAGFVLVDKPQGVTSHDVVGAMRGALHTRHVGHAGTLDPMATGLLVVGYGYATRLLKYIVGTDKTYEAVIRLGASTTTDDAEGDLIGTQGADAAQTVRGLADNVDPVTTAITDHFTGVISQVPSTFSAIKVNGERAYDLARKGETVDLAARDITISDFTVLSHRLVHEGTAEYLDVTATITCSAGTYIRALARDLGSLLGVGGHLTALRRTRIGAFDVSQAVAAQTVERTFVDKEGVTQHRLRVRVEESAVAARILDVVQVVRSVLPVVEITPSQVADLGFGRDVDVSVSAPTAAILRLDDGGEALCAIVEPGSAGGAHPRAVFPVRSENS